MKFSKREKFIALLNLTVVIIWGFYTFLYLPKKKDLERAKAEVNDLEASLSQLTLQQAECIQLEKELVNLEERLTHLQEKLSKVKGISSFLKNLSGVTSTLNLKVTSLLPKEESLEANESFKVYNIVMKLVGNYKALVLLLEKFDQMPLIIQIDQFLIEKGEKEEGEVRATLNLKIYLRKSESA